MFQRQTFTSGWNSVSETLYFKQTTRQWIMSKNSIAVLIYYHHKLLNKFLGYIWHVKKGRDKRLIDHSSPSSAEVKNGGAIPPLPHMFSWYNA
jgi:hypothetical protein